MNKILDRNKATGLRPVTVGHIINTVCLIHCLLNPNTAVLDTDRLFHQIVRHNSSIEIRFILQKKKIKLSITYD